MCNALLIINFEELNSFSVIFECTDRGKKV